MKQKNIPFNINVFLESFRQLRVTGIISVILMAGITILRLIDFLSYREEGVSQQIKFTGFDWMPWLFISFILITPVLMFQAFQFINKRNSSDFYHSLPHKRRTIYISISAAVMSWVIISILSAIIPSLLGALFFSKYIAFAYDTFFLFVLFNIASCFLVGGAIMIAKSLSGTIFNGIILTGLILFVPRFFISMIISTIESNPIFEGVIGNGFTNDALNPVTATVFSIWGISNVNMTETFISFSSIIYGFVLGLIYFVLGGVAFCLRKSETAAQSAPNRILQAVYRIVLTLALSSFVIRELFSEIHLYNEGGNIYWFEYVIAYSAIVFVYFMYELLATRKLKNLIRAIPGLGIVAVLNIAMFFGLSGIYKNEMSFRPAPHEINSVTLVPDIKSDDYYSINYYDYVLNKIGGLKIEDRKIIEDVSSSLNKDLSMADDSLSSLNKSIYSSSTHKQMCKFKIETNGTTKTRNVFIEGETYDELNKLVCSSTKFKEAWLTPPSFSELSDVYVNDYNTEDFVLTGDESEELYNLYRSEMKDADFDTSFENFVSGTNFGGFECKCLIGGRSYDMMIPINESASPRTAEKISELSRKNQSEKLRTLNEYLSRLQESGTEFEGDIFVYIRSIKNDITPVDSSWYFNNSLDIPNTILESRADDYGKYTDDMYMDINLSIYNVTDPEIGSFSCNFVFRADDNTIQKIRSLDTSLMK